MAHTELRGTSTGVQEVPPTIEATIDRLLDFITQKREVSFSDVHRYMDQEHLRFGANTNAIDILDLAAYRTGRIDVNYSKGMIYSRPDSVPPQPAQPHASIDARPHK
jgi:hypothetical protein